MVPEQIASDVRTVTSVAAHFAELKQSAARLLDSFGATQRGYFTPTEDEEVRHLLVSYWQSRNALIALARGLFHEGKPYDFDFDFTRSDRLVCTEVVYRSYGGVGGVSFSLTRRAGRLTLAAEDLVDMALARQFFDTLAVVAPQLIVGVATGSDAEHIIRTIAARHSAASMEAH